MSGARAAGPTWNDRAPRYSASDLSRASKDLADLRAPPALPRQERPLKSHSPCAPGARRAGPGPGRMRTGGACRPRRKDRATGATEGRSPPERHKERGREETARTTEAEVRDGGPGPRAAGAGPALPGTCGSKGHRSSARALLDRRPPCPPRPRRPLPPAGTTRPVGAGAAKTAGLTGDTGVLPSPTSSRFSLCLRHRTTPTLAARA